MAQPLPVTDRIPDPGLKHPINLAKQAFSNRKFEVYAWLREEAPCYAGRISFLKLYLVSRYDDCVTLLTDPRFVRNRSTATGGGRLPFPLPKSMALLASSMITEDEPQHKRLRRLVNSAFKPGAVSKFEGRITALTHELLDAVQRPGPVDLMPAYCLPIPMSVISELMGVSEEDMPVFGRLMGTLSNGLTGWRVVWTMFRELPRAVAFVRDVIARKRKDPQDDILTALIQAEEDGEGLSEDELVAMVFLLIVAGFETTLHLITNGVIALLSHPDQLARLRAEPTLLDSAVEELLRFAGPIHGTKMNYACEDVTWHGVRIPKGAPVMPLLGAANRDPRAFEDPDVFDIARTPNRHLAFSHGRHFCLGAQLARLETRLALATLLERSPHLRLAVPAGQLGLQNFPGWHRHKSLPVFLE